MRIKKYILLLSTIFVLLLAVAHVSWAVSETKDFKLKVRQMLQEKKFWELEKLAEQFRKEKFVFTDGIPKLQAFYDGLGYKEKDDYTVDERRAYIRLLEEWNDSVKNSATAKIALAEGYKSLAWDYRGGGWSDTITDKGSNKFEESLATAWQYLDEAEVLNNNDSHLYSERIIVGLGMGAPPVILYEAMSNSLAIFPGYSQAIRIMQIALLPRWGGNRGDVERFAEWVASMTADEYGDEMYAYAAWAVLIYVRVESFGEYKFDLPRVNAAFKKMWIRYPDIQEKHLHCYALMAVQGEDFELARKLFARIKYDKDDKETVEFWENEDNFNYWKDVAEGKVALHKDGIVMSAVKKGDLDTLKKTVAEGKDVNEYDNRGHSALIAAIENMNFLAAEYLVENGADLNYKDKDGQDALCYAAMNGLSRTVKLLLSKGINSRNLYKDKWTPLHYAVISGSLEAVKEITAIDRNLIYAPDINRWTALHLAANKGYQDIAEYLLELDPKLINLRMGYQTTPLHLAAQKGHDSVIEVLLKYSPDLEAVTVLGETPLDYALKSNDMKVINLLKDKGAREGSPVTEEAWQDEYAHYVKGNNTFLDSKLQESQSELDAAIQINPYHAGPYAVYAMLETHGHQNPQKGLEWAEKSLKLDPDYAYAYFAKGRALDALGRRDEALETFRKFIKLDPESNMAEEVFAHYPELK